MVTHFTPRHASVAGMEQEVVVALLRRYTLPERKGWKGKGGEIHKKVQCE